MPADVPGNVVSQLNPPAALGGASLEVIEAYQRATAPDAGVLDQVWQVVEADVAAGVGPQTEGLPAGEAGQSVASQTAAAPAAKTAWGTIVAAGVGVLAVGGLVVALTGGGNDEDAQADASPHNETTAAVVQDNAPVPEVTVSPTLAPDDEGSGPDASATPSNGDVTSVKLKGKRRVVRNKPESGPNSGPESEPEEMPVASSGESSLADERALLQRARKALAAGKAESCLRVLKEYDAKVSGGLLEEERDVLRIRALCKLERHGDAQAKAKSFQNRHPNSPHRETLLQDCR